MQPQGNFVLLAGPCVLEGDGALNEDVAHALKDIASRLGIELYFKSSYDKANRTSNNAYRGPGLQQGLEILNRIKTSVGVQIVTDVHHAHEATEAALVADMLQIPAFLCRQTDLLVAAGETGKAVNIKKGQFLAPEDMKYCAQKVSATGNEQILLTERGTSFGYHNLVVDMRGFPTMRQVTDNRYPVLLDATHSVQRPGGLGGATGGDRNMVPTLARAAMAAGCDGLFMEVHPDPDKAPSDGPNMLYLKDVEPLLQQCLAIREAVSNKTARPLAGANA